MKRVRLSFAVVSIVPVLAWSLAACTPPTGGGGGAPTCHSQDVTLELRDLAFTGPMTGDFFAYKNVTMYLSSDGSCADPVLELTVVVASSDPLAACQAVQPGTTLASSLAALGYATAPTDSYLCTPAGFASGILEPGTCYDDTSSSSTGQPDVVYAGPRNTPGNATFSSSYDGTCSGSQAIVATIVQQTAAGAAYSMCQALNAPLGLIDLVDTYAAPDDVFACVPVP